MRTPKTPALLSFLRLSPLRVLARSCRRWLSPRRAGPIRTRLPLLEALEDRRVPAAFTPGYLLYHSQGQGSPLSSTGPVGFTPAQIIQAYGFNQISLTGGLQGDGTGQTIAIVDAGDDPTILTDLQAFDVAFGLPDPPSFTRLNQTGGLVLPQPVTGWPLEISLDVEWAHALAPGANIVLVEAASANDFDMNAAITYAASQAAVVSMSFGEAESNLTQSQELSYDTIFTGHTGVTYVASSGDSGAPPIWPSASPYVVAAGGTTLTLGSGNSYAGEVGWSGSGGGISIHEAQPTYQQGLSIHSGNTLVSSNGFRATPDVAFDSDPASGFAVIDSYNYGPTAPWVKIGGTSAAAPQWSALIAIADEGRFLNGLSPLDGPAQTLPALYQLPAGDFHDITTGTSTGSPHYTAASGFDLVTGLGSPIANLVVSGLVAAFPGAHVLASTPNFDGQGGVNGVTLTFSEPIRSGGFPLGSVTSLTGPSGAIAPTGILALSSTQFEVTFASQTTPGNYVLVVGPNILDTFGNPMDQNGDGIPDEIPGDSSTTTFALPMPVTLPFQDNFDGGVASGFISQSGSWAVSAGRYTAAPVSVGGDAVTLLPVSGTLPANLQIGVTMNAAAGSGTLFSNGFVIFDYQGPTNFKFAGAFVGMQEWVIGHRDANGWEIDASANDSGIAAGTDFNLQLLLQGALAMLQVNGTSRVGYTYASSFSGSLGLGAQNSLTQFDNFAVQQTPAGTLPIQETFDNGQAPYFIPQSGSWSVSAGRYGAVPISVGGDVVSTLLINGTLPTNLEFDVTMNATAGSGSNSTNGFIIFDYQGPTNFKFAGAFVGNRQWVVGHRDGSGWHNDAVASDNGIAPGTDYSLQLLLQGANATLLVNGTSKVNYGYASGFTGSVGLGTENSVTQYDNLTVQPYDPPGGSGLPIQENFDDGQAHYFSPQSGGWAVSAGRYGATPSSVGADAVSTLLINGGPSSSLEFDVTMNAAAGSGTSFSNGFVIFDYQSPTNFKFAGAFVGNQQWVVGHRDANGWEIDAMFSDPSIAPGTDYNLQLLLQGNSASLLVNGVSKVSHAYSAAFSGAVGLGTLNSLTQFDNLTVKQS